MTQASPSKRATHGMVFFAILIIGAALASAMQMEMIENKIR